MHGVHCESENSHFHPSFLHLFGEEVHHYVKLFDDPSDINFTIVKYKP